MIKVLKKDGQIQEFDEKRIQVAIQKAFESTNEPLTDVEALTQKAINKLPNKELLSAEEIEAAVENTLMVSKHKAQARAYIEYRKERDLKRKEKDSYVKIGVDITSGSDTESQRENSNIPRGTVTTQLEMIKRNYSRQFVRDFILPKRFKEAHDDGDIHIHDLHDAIVKIPNCILMDYPFMLQNGFQLGNKWIEEPKTILTAMNILVQMVQVQAVLEFGGITLPDIDVHLGKYVLGSYKKYLIDAISDVNDLSEEDSTNIVNAYSKLHPLNENISRDYKRENDIAIRKTEKEVYKACRLLSYQINTLQVRGESSPFTTIGYGNSTTWEGRLIQKSVLMERLNEFNISGVQEFPKHMMAVRSGVNLNENDPNYDIFKLAHKVSAKTCYPDYIFPENQEKHTGGSAYYMGCRSLLSPWYNEKGEKQYIGRGNVSVVTVNIPRIAIEAKGDYDLFWKLFEERYNLAAEVNLWRYKRLITLKAKEAPFTYMEGIYGMKLDPEDTIEKVFANGRGSLSLGTIGMHEACLLMTGKEVTESKESLSFVKEMMSKINKIADEWKDKTSLGFSQYAAPSEALTDRFSRLDKDKFGDIKGVTDKGFYVNSFHVNTETKISPFEKIDIEAQLQLLSKGGHVGFVEVNNLTNNLEAYESIVKYAHDKGCMYIGLNAPWDFCKTCHWTGELELQEDLDYSYTCPECGENHQDKIVKTVRLCGYLSTANKRPPVAGRIKEIKSRVKHS